MVSAGRVAALGILIAGVGGAAPLRAQTPLQIYGAWHCGDDYCTWSAVRDLAEFDARNHWLVDRGDGVPSVNLVVLSFVNPLRLLERTNDAATVDGVPVGMTPEIVGYFKSRGIRVSLSIGGFTYVDDWNAALASDPVQLGLNAAELARRLGVGIEIDYEENTDPDLAGLEAFIDAYRSQLPYDPTGALHAARLTLDFAAGDRWLIDLTTRATAEWLTLEAPVLDYANAMVPARQPNSAQAAIDNWQEHVDGKPQYAPPILPLAPAKFTASLYLNDRAPIAECVDFLNSLQYETRDWAQNVAPMPGHGATNGILGFMFWAAECPSTRDLCSVPPDNSCEEGMGAASAFFDIPIPMPPLREQLTLDDAALETVERLAGGRLRLSWSGAPQAEAFEVVRGVLAEPFAYGHDALLACDLAPATTAWESADDQVSGQPSYYYLVVPRRSTLRGWGTTGAGVPRPPAAAVCP